MGTATSYTVRVGGATGAAGGAVCICGGDSARAFLGGDSLVRAASAPAVRGATVAHVVPVLSRCASSRCPNESAVDIMWSIPPNDANDALSTTRGSFDVEVRMAKSMRFVSSFTRASFVARRTASSRWSCSHVTGRCSSPKDATQSCCCLNALLRLATVARL